MGTRLPSLARVGDPAADEERRGQDRSWAHVQARKTAQKGRHLTSAILAAIDGEAAESDALGDPSQVANARRELKDAHDGFYFAKYEADALFSERLWYQTMLSSPLVSTISTFAQAHLVPPERRAQLTSLADKFNEIGLRCLERIDAINVHFAQRAVPTMYGQAPPGSGASQLPLTSEELETLRTNFYIGLDAYWDARSESAASERDALWSSIYTAVTNKSSVQDPEWMLRRWPLELVNWPVANSHRLDVDLRKDFLSCCGTPLAQRPIAADESPGMNYATDSPFQLDGGEGLREETPSQFLQAYWMARAYGQLGA